MQKRCPTLKKFMETNGGKENTFKGTNSISKQLGKKTKRKQEGKKKAEKTQRPKTHDTNNF